MKRSALLACCLLLAGPAAAKDLRVCADPNNLPFSNRAGQGFENKIAEVIAQHLGETVSYTWWAQRRGFARNTLKSDLCDLWLGVASGVETLATTRPYYRSTYVFVTRADRHLNIASFDDPRLRQLRIGVQMIGNDAQNTPPTHALARRGIVDNVRGYLIYGDYRTANPPAAIIDAVAKGDVDVAVVWGPLAGYFAQRYAAGWTSRRSNRRSTVRRADGVRHRHGRPPRRAGLQGRGGCRPVRRQRQDRPHSGRVSCAGGRGVAPTEHSRFRREKPTTRRTWSDSDRTIGPRSIRRRERSSNGRRGDSK